MQAPARATDRPSMFRRIVAAALTALAFAGWATGSLRAAAPVQAPPRSARTEGYAFRIVAGERFGPIREDTTRAALDALVPRGAVRDVDVGLGEGYCAPGAQVFAGTRDEVDLAWQDAARTRVALVRTTTPGGRWTTARGVRLGTSLAALERIAGHVVSFSGFAWDYSGGLHWEEGGAALGLRLDAGADPAWQRMTAAERAEIEGDRLVRSDHRLIRRLHLRVVEISQTWGAVAGDRFCG